MGSKSLRTRGLIIEKASLLFNTKGYHGTSMNDIMAATGLTKGGIYGNFKREGLDKKGVKEEIALAAFEFSVASVQEEIRKRTAVIENTTDKLKAVIFYYKERVLNLPTGGGCPLMNATIDADHNVPLLFNKVKEQAALWRDRIVHTINKGIKKGEILSNTDPEEFATFYIGNIEGGILLAKIFSDLQKFSVMAEAILKRIDEIKK